MSPSCDGGQAGAKASASGADGDAPSTGPEALGSECANPDDLPVAATATAAPNGGDAGDAAVWQDLSWQGMNWEGYAWQPDACWSGGWETNAWSSGTQGANSWWANDNSSSGYMSAAASSGGGMSNFESMDTHTARVHFTKTYGVLSEIVEAHPKAFAKVTSFVDLGCAPGGFSCRLLEECPTARGLGVTLPHKNGGFPILLEDPRFKLQSCDLMSLRMPEDLEFDVPLVDACLADAQDLGRRTNPLHNKGKGGTSKAAKAAAEKEAKTREGAGVQAFLSVLGIWAMTLQELLLGLGRLANGGTLCFRFGWRGRGANEESWYREATYLLFSLMMHHFVEVIAFKSEFSHQADASFYVVATEFRREDFVAAELGTRLREAIDYIIACEKVVDLPWCMDFISPMMTDDFRTRIEEMLETVGRKRAIGLASRHRVEAARSSPEAAIYISPVPFSLTMQRLRERLERFGKISKLTRRAHPIGVGADAAVQFTQTSHATVALEAVNDMKILGPQVLAQRMSEMKM